MNALFGVTVDDPTAGTRHPAIPVRNASAADAPDSPGELLQRSLAGDATEPMHRTQSDTSRRGHSPHVGIDPAGKPLAELTAFRRTQLAHHLSRVDTDRTAYCTQTVTGTGLLDRIVEGGVEEQTRQVVRNLGAILEAAGIRLARLPFSLRILLENLLRHEDGITVTASDIEALAAWDCNASRQLRQMACYKTIYPLAIQAKMVRLKSPLINSQLRWVHWH